MQRGLLLALVCFSGIGALHGGDDLTLWRGQPEDWKPLAITPEKATLKSDRWSYLVSPQPSADAKISAEFVIEEPATQFNFFGRSWSVWPDHTYGDQGFEFGLLLRGDEAGKSGYRVQFSHKLQEVALVRFPDGGYLRSVPCPIERDQPLRVSASITGSTLRVSAGDRQLIEYVDRLTPPLTGQKVALGVSSAAKVTVSEVIARSMQSDSSTVSSTTPPVATAHKPQFKARKWIGDRQWVFDGDEPILLLPAAESSYINNVKLRPGYKPQLSWNSHWDIQCQGAFPEGKNDTTDVRVTGGGDSLTAHWIGKHAENRFGTESTLRIGFDHDRGVYQYDVDSQLDVRGQPFHFRYGYDFEHHTPLDPFNWQYLVARKLGGDLYYRPVYPSDPGPQYGLEPYQGLRVWYGRFNEKLQIAPAVEYHIDPAWNPPLVAEKPKPRSLDTAVCAAFYDTAVSFGQETAPAGTKVRVKYRYTGYPADEAAALYEKATVYPSLMLDPEHHFIFADEWPKLTFSQSVPMNRPWQPGRNPFKTGHNVRPTYELAKNCGAGSGFAIKLGPASLAKAPWNPPEPLAAGRYVLTALVKADNVFGPGGKVELAAVEAKTNKVLASAQHFVGAGSFDWKSTGFVFEFPATAAALSLSLSNAGTGEVLVTDVEFRALAADQPLPKGVSAQPQAAPAAVAAAPAGAVADYRMEEQRGLVVYNYAGGELLDLANPHWVVDAGRPALKFTDNPPDRKEYRHDRLLGRYYLDSTYYADEKKSLTVATAGHHGGGQVLPALTLAAWIKPAAEMGSGGQNNKGDIIGYGARRFILGLHGKAAPYQLAARLNVNDIFVSDARIDADRWHHVALTTQPSGLQWQARLYLNGEEIASGVTKKGDTSAIVPQSIVLGAELFYFHDAFYRGLIGRTLVFDRVLAADEIRKLAGDAPAK